MTGIFDEHTLWQGSKKAGYVMSTAMLLLLLKMLLRHPWHADCKIHPTFDM